MHRLPWFFVLACAALLASTSLPLAHAQRSGGFDADERRALIGGALVRRDLSRREGGRRVYGGASWQRVEASPARVWQRATEITVLTQVIPSLDEARLVEEQDDTRVVYLHHSYGIAGTAYHLRMHLDHTARALTFELDTSRPHDITAGRGHMRVTPYRGGSIVEWGMLVDPGDGLVMELFGPMLGEWLLLPPRCLRDDLAGAPTC